MVAHGILDHDLDHDHDPAGERGRAPLWLIPTASARGEGAEAVAIRRNMRSIERVSLRDLPLGEARGVLLAFARQGYPVYVYRPVPGGLRCVWLGPLSDARVYSHDGAVPLAEWCQRWPSLLCEIAMSFMDGLPGRRATRAGETETETKAEEVTR